MPLAVPCGLVTTIKMNERPVQESFIDLVVQIIRRHGLQMPALLLLEAGRPAAFLGGQFLWVAQPALSLLVPSDQIRQMAALLEDPTAVRTLTAKLEASEAHAP